ncbi:hypothetical protein Y717_35130 [Streptomyces scopuliridis RB72]|uniref:Uncharacterized protein n=1 Tax=Streptomyces scopuliridis RB72 TaxID=1440053 RepID=A0A2T7SRW8_9ACTN|nr:hypothetical protein Y717_35130 [Streptomyces scopuliridis RB72]
MGRGVLSVHCHALQITWSRAVVQAALTVWNGRIAERGAMLPPMFAHSNQTWWWTARSAAH